MTQDRRTNDGEPTALSRGEVIQILERRRNGPREKLAARHDAAPEVLFFLATEGSIKARRAVAANASAPAHANRLLADDDDADVRAQLARKIGRLLPDLPPDASEKMVSLTIETLDRLSQDQLPRVRRVLAEEIKSLDCVPMHIVHRLAHDIEEVAAPILEYSPLLSDADLVEIMSSAQARYALTAIAKRRPLSANVSEAIATALDVPAVAALLANSNAQIREQTLEKIIEHGSRIKEWHLPLVLRNDLSQRAIRRIAGFVSAALLQQLAQKHDLDENLRSKLAKNARTRIDEEWDDEASNPVVSAVQEVADLHLAGKLDDAFVEKAVESGRRDVVIAALAILAHTPTDTVRRILQTGTAKPMIALVWRAKLSMRIAFKIQTFVMRLGAGELLPARDGIHFPMTEDEMLWHLNYFGITA
jgi:uncharacterized protein (DUF2336 family)